ncbi:GATA zinc finger domain-containing protein 14-like isoform X2 [Chelonus insularis]|uniref:GATA zinc finger domain-containing protein 14-like isoform X2 n=1 Tax=Chelonus insularis TaxID=460826 RepID=UPI00158DF674|nr:GATA zinc finger domain-containing protein 14-like isoform X2 [Chelonus insularis]
MKQLKMNKSEFAGLSYKELQAIASEYHVPGNIKKKILIKVLDAIKAGNDLEVAKLLSDVQNTRKKRTKKLKPNKSMEKPIASSSHFSNYPAENYLLQPQNIPTSSEERVTKDDKLFVPNYADFRQFFMRSGYQNDIKLNERSYMNPSVVDLRVAEASLVQAIPLDLHRGKNLFMAPEQDISNVNYQIIDTDNNFQTPLILKKMLQAPMGVNLKEIASSDGMCKIISKEENVSNNFMDDSDTLTAESETNENDDVDNNDNYFCIINNEKNSFNLHSNVGLQDGINEVNSNGNFMGDNENQYRVIYQSENQYQKWPDSNSLHQHQLFPNTEMYQNFYFDNLQANKNNTQNPYDFINNQVPYDINQIVSNPSDTYYNENSFPQLNNHIYHNNYNQKDNDIDHGYYPQCLQDNKDFLPGFNSTQSNSFGNLMENEGSNRSGGYYLGYENATEFAGNNHLINTNLVNNTNTNGNHCNNVDKFMLNQSKDCLGEYWPHWTQSNTELSAFRETNQHLENVLNLHDPTKVDTTKIQQTSSVYCYAAPVVSPKPLTDLAKVCSQQKRFIAEARRNYFSKYQMYNDSSTGRNMANSHASNDINQKQDNHDNQSVQDANKNIISAEIDFAI